MRVVSLVPAGTEIVAALGATHLLAGVSHECDWPPAVRSLPRVTATPVDAGKGSLEIDAQVRELQAAGRPVIAVDGARLAALEPDLLLVQDLCEVCAVTDGGIRGIASALSPSTRTLPLAARDLEGIFRDILAVGAALGLETASHMLTAELRRRLDALARREPSRRRRVICIEWLEPVFLAGHWVPDLIRAAGGEDAGAEPGSHSVERTLEEVRRLSPDVVLIAPCGFDLERAERELQAFEARLRREGREPPSAWAEVWLLDGNAYTSRPGPRAIEGAELIASALEGVERPGLRRWAGGGSRREPVAPAAGGPSSARAEPVARPADSR
ncbi:MAG: ABC transporter substrate-binding protein [Gemmatimonadales bacterium]